MQWQLVEPASLPQLAHEMQSWPGIVFDIETTSVDIYLGARLLTVAVAAWHEEDSPVYGIPAQNADLRILEPLFQTKPLLGAFIKFDLHGLCHLAGFHICQPFYYDIPPLARLVVYEEHPDLRLEALGERFLSHSYQYNLKKQRKALDRLPLADVAAYNCEDVWVTRRLYYNLRDRLDERLRSLYQRECMLTADLFEMERRGLTIDQDYLERAVEILGDPDSDKGKLGQILGRIRKAAGREDFNPRSNPQVRELLAGYPMQKSTPKGLPSWDQEALLALGAPEGMDIARYHALAHLRSGIFQRCIDHLRAGHRQMFGEAKNWGTVTGRLSGDLQQLTKGWLQDDEVAEEEGEVLKWTADGPQKEVAVRRLFKPREGYEWRVCDYRQIEMFVLGWYMQDKTFFRWLEAEDVHQATADEVWGPGSDREEGKRRNFGMVYGLGLARSAEGKYGKAALAALPDNCDHWYDQWNQFHPTDPPGCGDCCLYLERQNREQYFAKMPGYSRFMRRVRQALEREGRIRNVYGRYYMLDPEQAYRGVNYLTQGSSGDFVKFRLPATRAIRSSLGLAICNTTHDDFFIEKPSDLPESRMQPFYEQLTESPFGRALPLEVKGSRVSLIDLEKVEVAV